MYLTIVRLKFGVAKNIYSDRDPALESALFQLIMKMFVVKKLRTTGYNPRANGLTEKGNEFIKNYLLRIRTTLIKNGFMLQGKFVCVCTFVHRLHSCEVMYNDRNDDGKFRSIAEYERTLQDLYNVARESMQAR